MRKLNETRDRFIFAGRDGGEWGCTLGWGGVTDSVARRCLACQPHQHRAPSIALALPGFLIFPGAAPCQEVFGSVRGIVSDSTGATAAGARVFIVGTAFAVTAGPDGRYAIDFIPGGRYTVRAELGEYGATEQPAVLVLGGGTLRLDLRLGAAAYTTWPRAAAPVWPTPRT